GRSPGVLSFLPAYFVRGNADSSVTVGPRGRLLVRGDSTDVVVILESIFLGRAALLCEDAADTNDNGSIELTDAVLLLNHLFRSGPAPRLPYPMPGVDGPAAGSAGTAAEDALGCERPLPFFEPR
ncbi:MAG: hypothetical protein HY721_08630, partial [Planctomycetes bacterium]|nr:hypothetical protein [Planctomycetota bacterium]